MLQEPTEEEFSIKKLFVPLTTLKAIHIFILVGFIVYGNILFNGFVWDDLYQIVNSPIVHSANYSYYFTHTIGPFYKPLMFWVYTFFYQIFSLNAFYYHLFQINVHIINTIIIFLLFKEISKELTISFFLALLFLIHPINAETVEYIANYQDVMYIFFGLVGLLIIIKNKFGRYRVLTLVLLLLLSLFSKETGILFIIIYPLYYFIFNKSGYFKSTLLSLAILLCYIAIRYILVGTLNITNYNIIPPDVILTASLQERLLTLPKIIFTYLSLLIIPSDLSIQYWVVRSVNLKDFIFPLFMDLLFFAGIIWAGIQLFNSKKSLFNIYLFFFLWFCIGLGVHLQLVPLDKTLADRWFYFPFIGLLGLLLPMLSLKAFKLIKISKLILFIIFTFFYISLALLTIVRNTHWHDGLTLFNHEIVRQENVYELQYNYGYALLQEHHYDKAIEHLNKAINLVPNNSISLGNLCNAYLHASRLPEAEICIKRLINLDKNKSENYASLILVYLLQNNPVKAKQVANSALSKWPKDALLWRGLGLAYYNLHDLGLTQKAFEKSFTILPNPTILYYLKQIKEEQPIVMHEL